MREARSDTHHQVGQSRSDVMDFYDELKFYLTNRGLVLEGDETPAELHEAYEWLRYTEDGGKA